MRSTIPFTSPSILDHRPLQASHAGNVKAFQE